jgi:glucose/arabinose dehydrogenase
MSARRTLLRKPAVLAVAGATALGGILFPGPSAAGQDLRQAGIEAFDETVTFDDYNPGTLAGQDDWEASGAVEVAVDPLDDDNQVAKMPDPDDWSRRAIPAIEDGGSGTLFFRFYRDGRVDHNAGLSAADAPQEVGDFETQANSQQSTTLNARDGGAFANAGHWAEGTWQCVWMVADNASDSYRMYTRGGLYSETTQLPVDQGRAFGFRNGTAGALDKFFARNGSPNTAGDTYLDDIAVDTSGENLSVPGGDADDKCVAALGNPVLDPAPSNLGIEVEEYTQLPESHTTPPTSDQRLIRHNRINYIGEVPDGSGRKFVPDLNGMMYLVEDDGSYVEYLDVRGAFEDDFHNHAGLGTGFGFVEFHPQFAENGKFYTVHTESGDALTEEKSDFPEFGRARTHGIVTEWTAADPSAKTFEGTSRQVMRIAFGGTIHGIQQIGFNPTAEAGDGDYGLLYLLVGDGGNGFETDNPQDLSTPHGKIFRIDPLGSGGRNGEYGVPDSNPFVDDPDALEEIYAVGMRDPHRMSWDPLDGRMFLGHIGQWRVESIYEVRKGDNFGWADREGPFRTDDGEIYPLAPNDAKFGYTYPVAAYDHTRDPGERGDAGIAVAGGHVYRGADVPLLKGRYLFADLVRGHVYAARAGEMRQEHGRLAPIEHLKVFKDGQETTFPELVNHKRVDLRFGIDADGELFLLAKATGQIWRVTGARMAPAGGGGATTQSSLSAPDSSGSDEGSPVLPSLTDDLVAHYDFDHPQQQDASVEADQGNSGTDIDLVNGGDAMRVDDQAYSGAGNALQTKQVNPETSGNDDWKAGIYHANGVGSLNAFNGVRETTVMGWFKPTGENPGLNSNTANPSDRYNAVGLAGVLTGDSDGHGVRALLEVIRVDGVLKVVALGRRIDGSGSWTFAADKPWEEILLPGKWVHLAATFDFDRGEMQLFMNGRPLAGKYTSSSDPWGVGGGGGPFATSPTDPAGIKIGGSYPQDTREQNPCNCRMDDLMFLDRVPTRGEIAAQYQRFQNGVGPASCDVGRAKVTDVLDAEDWQPQTPAKWQFPGDAVILAEPGDNPGGPRRPFELATLTAGPTFSSVQFDGEVRIDSPLRPDIDRDVIVVFGYQSPTEYYYAHLSDDHEAYPHNGIFKVDNADRLRIDDQWDGSTGAQPAITDNDWHRARVRHCADTGEIAVYMDGADTPLMTATDTTFGSGRVGFGSFNDTGRIRDLTVSGTPVPPTSVG